MGEQFTGEPPMQAKKHVTMLLIRASEGNKDAMAELMPFIYDQLHELASYYMQKERAGHTLQTTEIVHEAYLKLIDQKKANWQNRAHFLATAARAMRRILVDYARQHKAQKRGGGQKPISLEDAKGLPHQSAQEIEALNDALTALSEVDERAGKIVELRYFGGLTIAETAKVMHISPALVKKEWSMARAWLYKQVRETLN